MHAKCLKWAWHLVGGRRRDSRRSAAPADSSLKPSGEGSSSVLSSVLLFLHLRNLVPSLEYVVSDVSKPSLSRKHSTLGSSGGLPGCWGWQGKGEGRSWLSERKRSSLEIAFCLSEA